MKEKKRKVRDKNLKIEKFRSANINAMTDDFGSTSTHTHT